MSSILRLQATVVVIQRRISLSRLDFLEGICQHIQMLIGENIHFFHGFSIYSVETMAIFSLSQTSTLVNRVKDKLASDIEACVDCCNIYYGMNKRSYHQFIIDSRRKFFEKFKNVYHESDLSTL